MRHKNPEYMKDILEYVDRFYGRYGRSPSCREIAQNTPLKHSAVHSYLVEMNENGMLEYNGQTIVTPGIRSMRDGMRRIGIVGSVACGLPTDASEIQDEYMNLPIELVGNDEVYIVYASGDSMIEAGIEDGDMVLVRKQEEARNNQIIVAYVEGEGNTLKRIRYEKEGIVLHPENRTMADIHVDYCRVQGVAIRVIKDIE